MIGHEPTPSTHTHESRRLAAHYPPLYPLALGAAALVSRADVIDAARWLHALLLAGNTLMAGLLVLRCSGQSWTAVLAASLMFLIPGSIVTHTYALSEALFILLVLCALGMLAAHLESPHPLMLVGAGVVTALAVMTRYVGAGMALAGVIVLLGSGARRGTRAAMKDAAAFAAIGCIPPALWLRHNATHLGSAMGRTIDFHPIGWSHARDAIRGLGGWLSPLQAPSDLEESLAVIGFALPVIVAVAVLLRRGDQPGAALIGVSLSFVISFIVVLAGSITFVDFHTKPDSRVLSPLLAVWIVMGGTVLAAAATASKSSSPGSDRWRRLAQGGAIALVAALAWPWAGLMRSLWSDGAGYAHVAWRRSPTVLAVRALPREVRVYSNAPTVVYLLTRRNRLSAIPPPIDPMSGRANPQYTAMAEGMATDLRAGGAVLVYFSRPGARQWYAAAEPQLKRQLGLRVWARFHDGRIYVHSAAPPLPATAPAELD